MVYISFPRKLFYCGSIKVDWALSFSYSSHFISEETKAQTGFISIYVIFSASSFFPLTIYHQHKYISSYRYALSSTLLLDI